MNTLLIILWLGFLGFIVWEFVMANQLPEKYSKLKPRNIRIIDVAIAVLILMTISYLLAN